MLATDKQISYLCFLAKKVERIKQLNKIRKSIVATLPDYIDWNVERNMGVTVTDASIRISAYKQIIAACNITFVLNNQSQII